MSPDTEMPPAHAVNLVASNDIAASGAKYIYDNPKPV